MRRFRVVDEAYPHFFTSTIVKWLPVFCEPSVCDIVISSWRYCIEQKGLRLHAYVIMPTHVHFVSSADRDLPAIIGAFKTHTSKDISRHFDAIGDTAFTNVFRFCGRDNVPQTAHKVWQDGNQPEIVHTEGFFRQKVEYLHLNPFRKGLVVDPLAWAYSSARDYAGTGGGPLEVTFLDW